MEQAGQGFSANSSFAAVCTLLSVPCICRPSCERFQPDVRNLGEAAGDLAPGKNPKRAVRCMPHLKGNPQGAASKVNRLSAGADDFARPKGEDKCRMNGKAKNSIPLDGSRRFTHPMYVPGTSRDCFPGRSGCNGNRGNIMPFQSGSGYF